ALKQRERLPRGRRGEQRTCDQTSHRETDEDPECRTSSEAGQDQRGRKQADEAERAVETVQLSSRTAKARRHAAEPLPDAVLADDRQKSPLLGNQGAHR